MDLFDVGFVMLLNIIGVALSWAIMRRECDGLGGFVLDSMKDKNVDEKRLKLAFRNYIELTQYGKDNALINEKFKRVTDRLDALEYNKDKEGLNSP